LKKKSTVLKSSEEIKTTKKNKVILQNTKKFMYMIQDEMFDVKNIQSPEESVDLHLSNLLIKKNLARGLM